MLAVLLYEKLTEKPANIPDAWPAEIRELGDGESAPSPDWLLMTNEELAAHKAANQAAYNTWAAAYYAPALDSVIKESLRRAKEFGQGLIDEVAVSNVMTGITQAGKTEIFINYCSKLTLYLTTGSLYAAITELNSLIADNSQAKADLYPFVTNDKITNVKNRIQDYLGIPRT